jgi:hypothetical protein
MLVGGISSSGYKSYNIITKEIKKGFDFNAIKYSSSKVKLRGFWKVAGLLKR